LEKGENLAEVAKLHTHDRQGGLVKRVRLLRKVIVHDISGNDGVYGVAIQNGCDVDRKWADIRR
jgi:hypothetical protein